MKKRYLLIISSALAFTLAGCSSNTTYEQCPVCPTCDNPTPVDPVTTYNIVDSTADHMSIVGIPSTSEAGKTITFSVACEPGYEFLDKVYVYQGETLVDLTNNDDGTYSFTMPEGDVEIKCDSQVSVFGLNYNIDDRLATSAYQRLLETDLVTEEFKKVAGTYATNVVTGSSYNQTSYYYEIKLSQTGRVTVTKKASEVATTNYYSKEGKYTVSTSTSEDKTTYTVKINITFDEAISYINGFTAELTFVEKDAETEGSVNTLVGSFTEKSTSSYYGGTYSGKTFSLTAEAEAVEENHYIYEKYDALPNAGEYLDVVYLKVDKTNYVEPGTVTINDNEVTINEDGYYPLSIPHHSSTIEVSAKTRYAPITINNGIGVEVEAYTAREVTDEEGKTVKEYTKVTQAPYEEQVYFKANIPEDGSYDLYNLTIEYLPNTSTGRNLSFSSLNSTSFVKNDDGYYTASNCKVQDMDLGLIATVTDIDAKYEETDTNFIGTGLAVYPGYTATYDFSTDRYGRFDIKLSNWSAVSYLATSSLKETGEAELTRNEYSGTYHAWTDKKGTYVIRSNSEAADLADFYACSLNNGETTPTFNWYINNSSYTSATAGIGVISGAREQNVLFADIDGDNKIDVNFDITFDVLVGDKFSDDGAIFDVKKGDTVLATYKMSKTGTITSVTKGATGTFTGTIDGVTTSIVSTGITATIGGDAPQKVSFGENSLYAIRYVEGKGAVYYAFNLDTSNNTFVVDKETVIVDGNSEVSVKTSSSTTSTLKGYQFNGTNISYSTTGVSKGTNYKVLAFLNEDNTLDFNWESSYYSYEINSDGNFVVGDFVLKFSEDGKTVAAFKAGGSSTYTYLLSKDINTYSTAAFSIKYAKFGSKFLTEIIPTGSSYGTENQNVYYSDGASLGDFVKVNVTSSDVTTWYTDKAIMTFTNVDNDDITEGVEYINISSTVSANVYFTYKDGDSSLVLNIDGTVTYGGNTFTSFTYDATSKTVTFETALTAKGNGEYERTRYTATIDLENKTATVSSSLLTYENSTAYTTTNDATHPWTVNETNGTITAPSGNNSTAVTYTYTFAGEGTFSFAYAVSSESRYDYFYIVINDTTVLGSDRSLSGSASGTYTVDVKEGDTIKLCYYKDGSGQSGDDNVVISDVSFISLKA